MVQALTPSQNTEQYVRNTYPCINDFIAFIQTASANASQYSPVACMQISSICQAAMKAFEYIQQNDSNANVVRVMRLLNDLYSSAWSGWVGFYHQAQQTVGTKGIYPTAEALNGIANFRQWDAALFPSPTFDPPSTLEVILKGVTP